MTGFAALYGWSSAVLRGVLNIGISGMTHCLHAGDNLLALSGVHRRTLEGVVGGVTSALIGPGEMGKVTSGRAGVLLGVFFSRRDATYCAEGPAGPLESADTLL